MWVVRNFAPSTSLPGIIGGNVLDSRICDFSVTSTGSFLILSMPRFSKGFACACVMCEPPDNEGPIMGTTSTMLRQ